MAKFSRYSGAGWTRMKSCGLGFRAGTVVRSFLTPAVSRKDGLRRRLVISKGSGAAVVGAASGSTSLGLLILTPFGCGFRLWLDVVVTRDRDRHSRPAETLDHGRKKFRTFVRNPAAMTLTASTMKRRPVRTAAGADMKHVVSALAVVRQIDLDANERIGVVEHVELQAHGASPSSAIRSRAMPMGDVARPALSRITAFLSVSSGQPNCSARLASTA